MKYTVEICCGGYEDALIAARGGASRVELNSALFLGGLTPSIGSLRAIKEETELTVISMVRPRGAGFYYSEDEFKGMLCDAKALLDAGSDGLAFGFLTEKGEVDAKRTKEFSELIHSYEGRTAVFHRAIDCCERIFEGFEVLQELSIDRALTSGGRAKAWDGRDTISKLIEAFGDSMEVLPGSGINAHNAVEMLRQTGATQVHSSCRKWAEDPTTMNDRVSYSYAGGEHRSHYEIVSEEKVKRLVQAVEAAE